MLELGLMLVTMRLALVVVALLSHAALADDRKQAAALFEEGLATRAKDPAKACVLFERSYALDPTAPGTALNVADCAEQAGKLHRAAALFDEAAGAFGKIKDQREKYARERAAAVAKRFGTLVVKLADPAGATVKIGGREVTAAAEIREQLDPGDVAIEISATGRVAFAKSVTLREGATETVDVDLPTGAISGLADAVRTLEGIGDMRFVRFTDADVVRHSMVTRIVQAYEEDDRRAAARPRE